MYDDGSFFKLEYNYSFESRSSHCNEFFFKIKQISSKMERVKKKKGSLMRERER